MISVLLGVATTLASAIDNPPTTIMRVGTFHNGEVPSVAGKNWFGLYVNGDQAELRPTTPRIKTVFDGINDDESNKASYSGKEVSLKGPAPLLLMRRTGLEAGVLKQAQLIHKDDGQTIQFENITYQVQYKCGSKNKESGAKSCKVYFIGNGLSQFLGDASLIDDSEFSETIRVLWAGDLDRDGKIDFIIEKSRYNNSDTILMLSTAAKGKQHAAEVAALSTQGC
ncbi:hypothetical protein H8K35_16120 [Undibacterium sp. LX40W]|uniref:Uncharacterized protein n=1 Tax=Undibacterium nitidum TaxID=2762298 RepID=A0A923HUL2_9BURK|nr:MULTISPECIES: hypothetical protein [Undibacterium]MBC3882922.1 hypothetical protein [Undibacterium nitidum]MBC3893203.1 hypothetical protein [Undibacterium sp. LX40W]